MLFPGQLQCSGSRSMDVINQGKCEGRPTFIWPVLFPWIRYMITFIQTKCLSGHVYMNTFNLTISQKIPAYLNYIKFEFCYSQ